MRFFKEMEIYLFEGKECLFYVRQRLKSSNSFTKVAQLPLLWRQ
jgi:hypothetical protein